jgi:tRNA-dihydrouridine synthase B
MVFLNCFLLIIFMKTLKIGNIKLSSPVILAPMVEVTDLPFRQLCRKYGAGLSYTEMVYVDSINSGNENTKVLIRKGKGESPLGIQVAGNNIEQFRKALPILKKYDLVDINCGCPSQRIIGGGAGSHLLKDPEKIAQIIRFLKSEGLVVTAKIRLGFSSDNVLEIAKIIESAGADALTIHARLATHGNNVPADWSAIKKVKQVLKIPVIGNGDVTDGPSAARLLEFCDGVMIARAVWGNPRVFHNINHYLKTKQVIQTTPKERIEDFLEYLRLVESDGNIDVSRVKYVGSSFLHGFVGSGRARDKFSKLKDFSSIQSFVSSLISDLK